MEKRTFDRKAVSCNESIPMLCEHLSYALYRDLQVEQVGFTLKAHGFFSVNPSTGMVTTGLGKSCHSSFEHPTLHEDMLGLVVNLCLLALHTQMCHHPTMALASAVTTVS
jgi:hypothetical protein